MRVARKGSRGYSLARVWGGAAVGGDAAHGRALSAGEPADGGTIKRDGNNTTVYGTAGNHTASGETAVQRNAAGGVRDGGAGAPAARPRAPRWLEVAAAWSWRLIVLGLLIYVSARVLSALRIVVLPCVGALLVTAFLQPLAARLRRMGLPTMAATWCSLLLVIVVVAGAGTLVGIRVSEESTALTNQLAHTTRELEHWLEAGPFHVRPSSIQQFSDRLLGWFNSHRSLVAGTVFTGGKIATEIFAGLILMLFITFFLIKDGELIWRWATKSLRPAARQRADRAGHAAWQTLVHWVRGTVVIAAIHATVVGVTLLFLRVPLIGPLTVLVFLASFVPIIGVLVAGSVSILVTFGTQGWGAALILFGVLVLANQLESHLLQPQIIGRMVRLHPLAIIIVLAVGGVVGGIPGAVIAVPMSAAISRAWPLLRDLPDTAAGSVSREPVGSRPAEPVGSPSEDRLPGGSPAASPGGPAGQPAGTQPGRE